MTPTQLNPYPSSQVGVLMGWGMGCPEKPQGNPCYSLPIPSHEHASPATSTCLDPPTPHIEPPRPISTHQYPISSCQHPFPPTSTLYQASSARINYRQPPTSPRNARTIARTCVLFSILISYHPRCMYEQSYTRFCFFFDT